MTTPDIAPIRARLLAATWQPIETAPDGVPVLVKGGWRKDRAEIVEADGGWWRHGAGQFSAQPTEWRPLPTDEHDADLAALLAHVDEQAAEIERTVAENIRLRAALAHSKDPCVYCALPADEWLKCDGGFPGCARADDASGCPELGALMELDEARAQIAALTAAAEGARAAALEEAAKVADAAEVQQDNDNGAANTGGAAEAAAAIRALAPHPPTPEA